MESFFFHLISLKYSLAIHLFLSFVRDKLKFLCLLIVFQCSILHTCDFRFFWLRPTFRNCFLYFCFSCLLSPCSFLVLIHKGYSLLQYFRQFLIQFVLKVLSNFPSVPLQLVELCVYVLKIACHFLLQSFHFPFLECFLFLLAFFSLSSFFFIPSLVWVD